MLFLGLAIRITRQAGKLIPTIYDWVVKGGFWSDKGVWYDNSHWED